MTGTNPSLRRRSAARLGLGKRSLTARLSFPLDLCALVVSVPRWVRPNVTIVAPDEATHHPIAEDLVMSAYVARLRELPAHG